MWVHEDGKIMTFSEFLLSESIRPKETEYGTDLHNREWKSLDYGFNVTCFESNNGLYLVVVRNEYIGFYSGYLSLFNDLNDITEFDDVVNIYSLQRTNTNQAIPIFNKVFYIITEAIKHFDMDVIRFDGNDKDLGGLYDTMIKNKFFIKQLNDLGFVYNDRIPSGKYNFFEFTRKSK